MKKSLLFLFVLVLGNFLLSDYATGVKLFKEGKYEEALLRFEELMKEQPDQWQSFYYGGLCYQRLNKIDKAKEAFEKALSLQDDFTIRLPLAQIYFNEKNYEKVTCILKSESLKDIKPESKKSAFKLLSTSYYLLGKYREAIPFYKEYLILDSDPTVKYYLGLCLYRTDSFDEAAKILEEAVKADPEYLDAYSLLASVYLELISSNPSKKDLYLEGAERIGVKLVSLSDEYSYLLAKIYMMNGKYSQAMDYFEKATKQKDNKTQSCYAYYYLGFVKAKLENFNGALAAFDSAEKCLQDEAALKKIYCQKGLIFHSQSNFQKAIELYEKGNCSKDLIEQAKAGRQATEAIQRMKELIEQLQDLTKMK